MSEVNDSPTPLSVAHDEVEGQFQVDSADGVLMGTLRYHRHDGWLDAYSTFVDPAFRGASVASSLTDALMAWATGEGVQVMPSCTYVARYFDKHPEVQFLRYSPSD